MPEYNYHLSSDIDTDLKIKICNLIQNDTKVDSSPDFYYISVYASTNGKPLGGGLESKSKIIKSSLLNYFPATSSASSPQLHQPKQQMIWNEWLVLPFKYLNISSTSAININLYKVNLRSESANDELTVVAGASIKLVKRKKGLLKQGKLKVCLWLGKAADPGFPSTTPSKGIKCTNLDSKDPNSFERLLKKYECGEIQQNSWLDSFTLSKLKHYSNEDAFKTATIDYTTTSISSDSSQEHLNFMTLFIELPKFNIPVFLREEKYILKDVYSFPGSNFFVDPSFVSAVDFYNPNIYEAMHRRLLRNHHQHNRLGSDMDLKPSSKTRDTLDSIAKYSPLRELKSEEKDLLWKYRYYLSKDPKMITKFLKSVIWDDEDEVKEVGHLLYNEWVPIVEIQDALELLSSSFKDPQVRLYAINQLKRVEEIELSLYLLQLVQAVRYEDVSQSDPSASPLVDFLIQRSKESFLIASHFYWFLLSEVEDENIFKMPFSAVLLHLMNALSNTSFKEQLKRQAELVASLVTLCKEVQQFKGNRVKKIEFLKKRLSDPTTKLISFPPLSFPLDPTVQVVGIIPEKSNMFKSSLSPLKLVFVTSDFTEYPVIFKYGDDLRQDQLVIQMIHLMERLLLKDNLDLKLSPYKVLATSHNHGMIQYIQDSSPLASILAENNNSLVPYLKGESDVINPIIMENYIRSCAGYCVITYILGVGDRHLDNLMLTKDGHLFHIDFGFILGRDPKPFPPPMKLCKEMVEVLNSGSAGMNSPNYIRFKTLCFTAFSTLRKSSNLVLNLFSLMLDANIPDISLEPDKVLQKLQDKFCISLSEEESIAVLNENISDSVSALFPQVIEAIHKWAQYWRK